jgi:hypothetical protein
MNQEETKKEEESKEVSVTVMFRAFDMVKGN